MIRALALLLGLVAATPAPAGYVLNNLRFTLYHEVGHAVIDQARVPMFGTEENAADGFALVLADRLHPEAELRDIVTDLVALGRSEAAVELFDPWSGYMPGGQRIARAICLWFGMNPEPGGDLARALGMPPELAPVCRREARALDAAWRPVLERLRPGDDAALSLRPAATGKALRLLGPDIARVNALIALPHPTPVTVETCGDDNAFYYHYDDRMEICAEMVEVLRRAARAQ